MAKKRDYVAEYKRRIQRAKAKGYSLSIARGHPSKKTGEIGLRRARTMLLPGPVSIKRQRSETRHGYRPTYAAIRKRLESLNLKLLGSVLKGKRGKIPTAWVRPRTGNPYLDDDETRDEFIDVLTRWGFTEHEAYTLWFSP